MMEPRTQDPTKVKALSLNRAFKVVEHRGLCQLELSLSTTLNGLTFYASTYVGSYNRPFEVIAHELERSLMGEIRKVLFAGTEL